MRCLLVQLSPNLPALAVWVQVGEGVQGDPIVCGVAVENEIFKQANSQVSQVRGRRHES